MNEEVLKDVLEDVLEELKEANRSLTDMRTRLAALEGKTGGFEQKLSDQQVIVHPPDLTPVANAVTKQGEGLQSKMETQVSAFRTEMEANIRRLALTVEAQPKPIVRQWRISLFPESDRSGSYKHFINWLFGGIVLALLVGVLYTLGRQYIGQMAPAPADVGPGILKKEVIHQHSGVKRIRPEPSKMP